MNNNNNNVGADGERDRHRSFQRFFQSWIPKQDCDGRDRAVDSRNLHSTVDQVIVHYELYYKSKSMWSRYVDVAPSTFPLPWQDGPMFLADGWRPSLAFHILYSKSGVQMENRLLEILRGEEIGDLGDLSESQLSRLDALQKEVVGEEDWISENLKVAVEDTRRSMVEEGMPDTVRSRRVARLKRLMRMADGLRIATLMKMDAILTPLQRTHFQISGEEMQMGIHEWAQSRFPYLQARGNRSGGGDDGGNHA